VDEPDYKEVVPIAAKKAPIFWAILKRLFFPLTFVYLEIVFHLYMDLNMQYMGMIIPFAVSMGLFFSLLTIWFSPKLNVLFAGILTVVICIVFCVEMICKIVLQQYYQLFSVASTATQNKLTDYTDAVITGIAKNIPGLLLLLVPIAFMLFLGRKIYRGNSYRILTGIVILFSAIIIHITGFFMLEIPWEGDFTPKALYEMDTNIEDQVEQLGLINMLRLDVKHSLFGVKKNLTTDFASVPSYNIGADNEVIISNIEDNAASHDTTQVVETLTPALDSSADIGKSASGIVNPSADIVDTSPNIMDIDFDSLIASAPNDDAKWLGQYFKSMTPTKKNEYTGMFKGYNVIFITAEGFSKYLIDKDRTPTLYKLANEGFVFNNYYTPLHYTSTSGGEFQNMVGLYPKNGNPISMKETGEQHTGLPFTLGNQLSALGYFSIGFHNNGNMYGRNLSHPNLGYDWKQGGEGFTMETNSYGNNVWPQSDLYLMEQTVDQYINQDKFNVYYVTVSGHMPYNFKGDAMAIRNKDMVADLPYSEETKAYIAANYELEKALTYLVNKLEEAGKADKTLIVLSPDHIPYFNVNILEELSGKTFGGDNIEALKESDVNFDVYRNSLIIWSESMEEPVTVDKICGQIDILPTVSNLLGLQYDSRLLTGSDILSTSSPLVIFSSSSWLTDLGLYNRYTELFTPASGVSLTQDQTNKYVDIMKKVVNNKLEASVLIVEQNYYNSIFRNATESQEEK